jgi:hypothetical protein
MKKILRLFINPFIFFFLIPAAYGQTAKFDITTYTPPKNLQSQKFGAVIYTSPANWKEQLYTDGVIWTATGLQPGELLLMQLMQPINLQGTLEEALQKSYDEICVSLKASKMHEVNGGNYAMLQPKKSFKGWDYIRCSGGIQMGDGQSLREYGLDVFLIKINNRYERVYVLKSRNNCNLSRYYPSDKLNYHNDIENFLFSLKFQDWRDAPVTAGSVKGVGIVGVWEGIVLRVGMPKPGAQLGVEYKIANVIFFSNGQAYYGITFPIEGLDEANTWIYAENNRRDWGTYTFINGKGILKMPYQEIPLRMENNKLIVTPNKTDHTFMKLNGVDGAKFTGTYVFSSKYFLGTETGKTPTILFSTDGKFSDKGAMSIMYHQYVDCLNIAKQPGTGTYEVKNHSLIFNYADGRKIKIAFIGSGYDKTNLSPPSLSFSANEDVLVRQ